MQACLIELEATEDPRPTPDPVQPIKTINQIEYQATGDDEPIDTMIAPTDLIKDETRSTITPSAVQKTVRVIRRTILQNGKEISVEEEVEEEPTTPTLAIVSSTEAKGKRRSFKIPSPFGIVEEPLFPQEQERDSIGQRGSVEITDVTDQYNQSAVSDVPCSASVVEIHEVLDDRQVTQLPDKVRPIEELGAGRDEPTDSEDGRLFDTLHEHEEETECHDEPTNTTETNVGLDAKHQTDDCSPENVADVQEEKPQTEKLDIPVERLEGSTSGSQLDSVTRGPEIIIQPEIVIQEEVGQESSLVATEPVVPIADVVQVQQPECLTVNKPEQEISNNLQVPIIELPAVLSATVDPLEEIIEKANSTIIQSESNLPVEQVQQDSIDSKDQAKIRSTGDDSESEVENMDWNVLPDDERQFDEYFKERPSSASSGSSTSTDTTHIESQSEELLLNPAGSELVRSQDIDPTLSLSEDDVTDGVKDQEPIQNITIDKSDPIQSLSMTESIPEVIQQSDSPSLEGSAVEKETAAPAKISDLTEQFSQQLVEQVLQTVQVVPSIERLISEEVAFQQTLRDSSSSSSGSSDEEFDSYDVSDIAISSPVKVAVSLEQQAVTEPENLQLLDRETSQDFGSEEKQPVQIVPDESNPAPIDSLKKTESFEVKILQEIESVVSKETADPMTTETVTPEMIQPTNVNVENPIGREITLKGQLESTQEGDDIVQVGESILQILPEMIEKLTEIDSLAKTEQTDRSIQRFQSQEEDMSKERSDALNIEDRESVAPTLGDNTTGPPNDDAQVLEQVARLVSERAAFMAQEAQQEELNAEWQEIQDLLASRLDQLRQGAQSSTHTSSVRYLATVTQVTVDESVEERREKLNDNLIALRTAVQHREVVVIQRIVITIVRTVSEWLETIEYRVYTIKQTKSMERRTEQIQSLCEEVRVVEESLNTLEEVTEMAVEVVNEETKVLLHKCVQSLQKQMQSVSEVTKRSEGEIEHIRRQWSDYLERITNEEDRIRDLMNQLRTLQSSDQLSSREKLVQLEDIETAVEKCLEDVTGLIYSGHDIIKTTPFYQMPENVYALLDTIKAIENAVRDEREVLLHKAALTAEYHQTLQEFAEIVRLSEALAASKLTARSPAEASLELEKRQRFLYCLSHFLQVLDTLEPHLDLDTRALCRDLHAELVVQAGTILDRAVSRQDIVEMALTSWHQLEHQWLQEEDWFNRLEIPDTSVVSGEAFVPFIEALQVRNSNASYLLKY